LQGAYDNRHNYVNGLQGACDIRAVMQVVYKVLMIIGTTLQVVYKMLVAVGTAL
jgi:hypothetical protein